MNKTNIITGILALILGLVMLIVPAVFIKFVVILLGSITVISGVVNLIVTRSLIDDSFFKRDMTVRGVGGIVIGLLAVCLLLFVAEVMWTAMMYILAAYLLVAAVLEVHAVSVLKQSGQQVHQYIIEVLITLFCAIILFLFPADFGITFIRIAGVILVLCALSLIIYTVKTAPIVISVEAVSDDIPNE